MRQLIVTILLASLLAAPARAQVGPQLTQSSVAGGGGASAQGPTRVEGSVGQASTGASSGGAFTIYGGFFAPGAGPSVLSVARASANPATQNSSVNYSVTFDAPVTGVDAADFHLTTAGLAGASVTGVNGSGASYDVTVDTGTPASAGATLRLDVVDDDTIMDAAGDRLGGAGVGNGGFTAGEVYTVNPVVARANDGRVSEPSAGSASLLFTVTLSAPAPGGGLSLSYATADGGANPATGGGACGGSVDYVSAPDTTLAFAAGERFKTVAVTVCADASGSETDETLLLNISNPSAGQVGAAQAVGSITQGSAAGALLISELRTSGPAGPADDFVELYNNTDSPLTVAASDASAGYGVYKTGSVCDASPVLVGVVPNGTVIPARGHYLLTGSAYSLADHGGTGAAAGDLSVASDIESGRGVAVFTTADVANVSTANRLDAVGFGTSAGAGVCGLLGEGGPLAAAAGSADEHSFFRKQCDFVAAVGCQTGGSPKDSNDNAADFLVASTSGGSVAGVERLGVPGPENLSSPVRRDTSGIIAPLLDGSASASAAPNRVRDLTSDPSNNSTFGTLSVRRRVVNNTGGAVTRLRFRIVEMTTYPAEPGNADMRARTSGSVTVMSVGDATTCAPNPAPCSAGVQGTTLEAPPAQPNGGGYNSTLAAGTVTTATPLANGASVNVQFLLGVQTTGKFRFYIIVEALP